VEIPTGELNDVIGEISAWNDGIRRFSPAARDFQLGADATLLRQVLEIGLTVGVIVVGIAIIRYYRQRLNEEPATDMEILADFQAAYEAGDLDFEEYTRVREALLGGASEPKPDKPPVEPEL
jgi:hypothetical protein